MKLPFSKPKFRLNFNLLKRLKISEKHIRLITLVIIILLISSGGYIYKTQLYKSYFSQFQKQQQDKYVLFLLEVYDKIVENYWDKVDEEKLANLYKLAAEKVSGKVYQLEIKKDALNTNNPVTGSAPLPTTEPTNKLVLEGSSPTDLKVKKESKSKYSSPAKTALEKMLTGAIKEMDETKKKEFSVNVAAAVLANLQPFGRSGLFTTKQEEELKNTVQNINPGKDLYKDLGLQKGAPKEQVAEAAKQKQEELKKQQSPEAKKELEKVAYAQEVLTDQDKKQRYDTKGVEPTVSFKFYTHDIVYLRFLKYSPTTYEEFVKVVESFNKEGGPRALIFDLRSNIGGAVDFVPFFLGNFLGKNQTAFELFQQGKYESFKTTTDKLPWLARLRQVVIMVDNQTQSSAELMSSALKKYRFAVIVGEPTKGWGTIEKVFPLDNQIDQKEKYSMFLVHHITIRDDGEPIEGKGVEPNINIKSASVEDELFTFFRYPEFGRAVKRALKEPVTLN
ncbi:hypothetical protein HYW42_04950 [Candidatus Daviesbacteria bacterium]|nr:hypothetical protein [Candidatus Daviesbacteria bacterium]